MAVLATVVGTGLDTITQHTYDYTYISLDLKDYDVNYTPEFNFPWQVYEIEPPTHRSAQISSSGIASNHRAITPGHFSHSYLEDFYYRFHFNLYDLSLGPILADQEYTLAIWNAWFNSVNLNTVAELDIGDITLDLGTTLPKTFTQLELLEATITVPANGQAVEDGYYVFTFDTQIVVVHISGQRAAIFQFPPLTEFTEIKEWKTDILSSKSAEQRFALRTHPRQTFSYKYIFQSEHEFGMARQAAKYISQLAVAVPLWEHILNLGALPAGTTVLNVDTSYMEIEPTGAVVFLFDSYQKYELIDIASFTSSTITLGKATTETFSNCWVTTAKAGYLNGRINLNRTPNGPTADLSVTVTKGFVDPIWPSPEVYLTLPILETTPIVTGGLNTPVQNSFIAFDSEIGNVIRFNDENSAKQIDTLRFAAHTPETKYNLRRFLDYFSGKYEEFWLPTFNKDLTALETIISGDDTLIVQDSDWILYPGAHIRVIGSSTEYFAVTNVLDNGNGTETITLSPTPTSNIESIRRIEILLKVRLDSDRIEYNYDKGRNLMVNVPVREVP